MRWHYFPTGACLFTFLIYALAGDVISLQSATHKASLLATYNFYTAALQPTECGCVMRELMYKMQRAGAAAAAGFHLAGAYLASQTELPHSSLVVKRIARCALHELLKKPCLFFVIYEDA